MTSPRRRIYSFGRLLTVSLVSFIIIALLAVTISWYYGQTGKFNQDFSDKQNMTEKMLTQSVIWIDRGVILYEMAYNPDLTNAMAIFQEKYQNSAGDITNINLSALKHDFSQKFHGEWDLYIINSSGIVTYTTFPPDQGLNFSRYPSLFKKYSDYMQTGDLIIDRTVKGFASGAPHRKFAYQGTEDHTTLLEISRNFVKFYPENNKASYRELINATRAMNPNIISIHLYNSQNRIVAASSQNTIKFQTTPSIKEDIQKTFRHQNSTTITQESNNRIIEYLFLPVEESSAPSTYLMNLVARIEYTTEPLHEAYLNLMIQVSGFLIITCIVTGLVAYGVVQHLMRPLNRIGMDVDQIAHGNLNHQITPTGVAETQRIEQSINRMVIHLKEHIEKLRTREEDLRIELEMRREAEMRYRRLFDSSHDAIFILEDGYIKDINLEASILLRSPREEIIGKTLIDFSPQHQESQDTIMHRATHMSRQPVFEKSQENAEETNAKPGVFQRPDGSLIETEVYVNRLSLDKTSILQVMVRDVTIINEMMRREFIAITQLEENLVRLAAVNDQIRNPLSIITIICENEQSPHIEEIMNQVKRIDQLIVEIDKGFISTDKVRMYLQKHYEVSGNYQKNVRYNK